MLQHIINSWYALSAGLFRHFNIWYVLLPGFLALAPVIGYRCIYEDQRGRRMCRLQPPLQKLITGLAGTIVGAFVYFESRVGIMHLLSGGRTAEQLQDDLGIRFWALVAVIAATVVYVWALRFVAHQGANQKRKLINRLRAERKAAAQAAEEAHGDAPETVAATAQLRINHKRRPAAAMAAQTTKATQTSQNDHAGHDDYTGRLPRLVGREAVG